MTMEERKKNIQSQGMVAVRTEIYMSRKMQRIIFR
jgi:hypothetical protein